MRKRRLFMRLTALLSSLALISALLIIVPAVGSDQSEAIQSLEDLSEVVKSELPKDAFANLNSADGRRGALVHKIRAVIHKVEAGAYKSSVNKLKNDIKKHITNWIADETWETYLLALVDKIISLIEGVLPPNLPPVAEFTESAETVLTNEVINFDASESYDPDGYIVSFFWDFGDGTNATGITTDHSYAEEGTYTVTLTVTDDDGATASANATKTAGNISPVAEFIESAETVLTGVTIDFDASSSYDPDGVIVSYEWNFGDGTSATGVTTDHAYADDGVYTVTLTVTDDDGATDTATSTKTVTNRPPIASFTENATTVLTGEVINFDASGSEDPDGSIVSYLWDFGDGNTAADVKVNHAYEDDGVYTVTLTVTDDDGTTASKSTVKTVLNRLPVAYFTENATVVKKGEVIHFDASESYDPDGYIVSFFWDFGDGTNATGITADHAYVEDGNFTVTLTVTDDDGAFSSVDATKMVEKEAAAGWPLALLAAICLGIAALTATLVYGLYRRRKKRGKASSPGSKPLVTLYVPAKLLAGYN